MSTSELRLPHGAAYRTEFPTVNTAEAIRALLKSADELVVTINRVTGTYGVFRRTRN